MIIDVDISVSLVLPDVRTLVTFERRSRTSIEIDIFSKNDGIDGFYTVIFTKIVIIFTKMSTKCRHLSILTSTEVVKTLFNDVLNTLNC